MAPRLILLSAALAACSTPAIDGRALPDRADDGAADSGAAGDSGDSADSGDSGDSADSADSGDSGDPCVDPEPADGAPLAAIGECGRLVYGGYANRDQDHADNHLPDFSFAGYERGGVAIPGVAVAATVSPESGDDRARIQAAIDAVSALPVGADGFRGAVLLTAGNYQVDAPLRIEASGVVLRGEGQAAEGGTRIRATAAEQYTLVEVGDGGAPDPVDGSERRITDAYVPVGAVTFGVEDAGSFAPGDAIVVRRTPNSAWVRAIGMDDYGWDGDSYAIAHEREVVAVDEAAGTLTVDIPVVDPVFDDHGGGQVERLGADRRIDHVGIEDLRLDSDYDGDEDEDHGWVAVGLVDVQDAFVRRVTARHFGRSAVQVDGASRFVTVEEVAFIDPVSTLDGSRRYAFDVEGGLGVLFQRCYAGDPRHAFVTGSRVTGPHVWLDALAERPNNDDGPHHRWATGLLFDNVRTERLRVQNRADSGSGHGWAGAQVLFWNGEATDNFVSDAPPAAMNWVVGIVGDEGDGQWVPEEPPGMQESLGRPVTPRSLYLQQLEDRLGAAAVEAVTTPAQRDGTIWDALAGWAGEGRLE